MAKKRTTAKQKVASRKNLVKARAAKKRMGSVVAKGEGWTVTLAEKGYKAKSFAGTHKTFKTKSESIKWIKKVLTSKNFAAPVKRTKLSPSKVRRLISKDFQKYY